MQLALFCFNLGGWVGVGLAASRDGYSIERPEPLQTVFQGTFRFQVEPNWAHLGLFRELTT